MGQIEILKFLEKEKDKWYTTKEMSEKIKISPSTVALLCKKLWKQKEIDRDRLDCRAYIYRLNKKGLNKK